ncbi:Ycf66 family protein [Oculatella sp. LEGE 06141]|uniref:Ycf66 family protein n=1 Tax=Oculatella sp. LEGE 06141 TaxID=1828648 RepID=UPI00187EBEC2|nr:Ycf66 family protein [Oculatella sp. LEGE 06141]MBE9177886.1 Ycf66 family protein [Oculatella sp. LEGE 06141]
MLAHFLALAVGFGSFGLYMAAFFFPEVHRKYDFIWSGVGLFYALVLWVCAGRITGGVLLGQTASVSLLGWFGWQTLKLRREMTPLNQQTQVSGSAKSAGETIQTQTARLQANLQRQLKTVSLPAPVKQVFANIADVVQGMTSRASKSPPKPPRSGARASGVKAKPAVPESSDATVSEMVATEFDEAIETAIQTDSALSTEQPTPETALPLDERTATAINRSTAVEDAFGVNPDQPETASSPKLGSPSVTPRMADRRSANPMLGRLTSLGGRLQTALGRGKPVQPSQASAETREIEPITSDADDFFGEDDELELESLSTADFGDSEAIAPDRLAASASVDSVDLDSVGSNSVDSTSAHSDSDPADSIAPEVAGAAEPDSTEAPDLEEAIAMETDDTSIETLTEDVEATLAELEAVSPMTEAEPDQSQDEMSVDEVSVDEVSVDDSVAASAEILNEREAPETAEVSDAAETVELDDGKPE